MIKQFGCQLCYSIFICMLLAFSVSTSHANTYTFNPNPSNLNGLDHSYAYTWGINWNIPDKETITGATLTFSNIYDYQDERGDRLYVHLLDSVQKKQSRTHAFYDFNGVITNNDHGSGDYYSGKGVLLTNDPTKNYSWSDPYGGRPKNFNLVLTIDPANYSWLTDGNFGFGIDPDCHYYNSGITLTITTAPAAVPEPCTMLLLGSGLTGIAAVRRKFKKA